MKHIIRLLSLLLIGASTTIYAQDTIPKKDTTKVGKIVQLIIKDTVPRKETKKDTILEKKLEKHFYGFSQFAHETYLFIAAPTRWHKADWLRVGVALAGTAAFMPFDQRITNMALGNDHHYYYSVAVVGGRVYGEWYTIGSMTALFAGIGIITHNDPIKKIGIELFQAGVYSELFTEVLKVCVGRARPYENDGPFNYRPFSTKLDNDFESMPSGHATAAFALSTVMSRHANSTFLKILAYVPAGFTLFARIYQVQHWASDEFLGAAVGFATGNWVVTLHEGRRHKINIPVDNK
jgi:membrane-associated phospholipid phosphatase